MNRQPDFPDGTNFVDIDKKVRPDLQQYPMKGDWVECHVCHGYGGWNMQLNYYGPGKHSKCWCTQCNGWGWVEKGSFDDTCPRHNFTERTIGNCLHEWKCSCGERREVDTSG